MPLEINYTLIPWLLPSEYANLHNVDASRIHQLINRQRFQDGEVGRRYNPKSSEYDGPWMVHKDAPMPKKQKPGLGSPNYKGDNPRPNTPNKKKENES